MEYIETVASNVADMTLESMDMMEMNGRMDVGGEFDFNDMSIGGGGGPEKYISMIKDVGAWAASVSAAAGSASAWSGAMQSAASKVGS